MASPQATVPSLPNMEFQRTSNSQNEPKTLTDFQLSGQLSCHSTHTTPCITRLISVSQVDCWSALLAQDKDTLRHWGVWVKGIEVGVVLYAVWLKEESPARRSDIDGLGLEAIAEEADVDVGLGLFLVGVRIDGLGEEFLSDGGLGECLRHGGVSEEPL